LKAGNFRLQLFHWFFADPRQTVMRGTAQARNGLCRACRDATVDRGTDPMVGLRLKRLMSSHDRADKCRSAFAEHSTQTEPLCQHLKRILQYLLRFFAELPVKVRIIVRVHAAFERFCISRAIKEPRRDAQRADPITSSPCRTNFVRLAVHLRSPAQRTCGRALPELVQKLEGKSNERFPDQVGFLTVAGNSGQKQRLEFTQVTHRVGEWGAKKCLLPGVKLS
jgi:hypothetical protein